MTRPSGSDFPRGHLFYELNTSFRVQDDATAAAEKSFATVEMVIIFIP